MDTELKIDEKIGSSLKAPRKPFGRRKVLLILLVVSFACFMGVVFVRFQQLNRVLEDSSKAMDNLVTSQQKLEGRLAEVERSGLADKTALEQKLKELSDRQTTISGKRNDVKAPFPLEVVMKSIVEIVCIDNKNKNTYYTASGTSIDLSGLIITNRHILVSDDGSLIKYCGIGFTTDMAEAPSIDYIASTVAVHQQTDLALLKILERVDKGALPKEFPAISLAGSAKAADALNMGDPVFIGGYPDIGAETFTFTQGVVSGRVGNNYIKTSALIDSGASGGGGFDSDGHYIGVPTAAAKGEIGGSLGYLIGADVVDKFMTEYEHSKK